MQQPVNDDLVVEYARLLRAGGPLGEVFPWPISQCLFTDSQKLVIKEARKDRKKLQRKSTPPIAPPPPPKPVIPKPAPLPTQAAAAPKAVTPVRPPAPRQPTFTKLEKMLYLQQGRCFFCGEQLAVTEANIEHLHPLSSGGERTEDNEVVCHKSLNETFGNLPLKQKFEFVLKTAGAFRCPKK